MNDAPEASDPDLALQMLSAYDPAAQASIMRHIVALRLMVTGRLKDSEVAGVSFGAASACPRTRRRTTPG